MIDEPTTYRGNSTILQLEHIPCSFTAVFLEQMKGVNSLHVGLNIPVVN